jgi:hypothetical protein
MIIITRRTTGTILLMISAFLYGIRYLSAAIFGSGVSSWDRGLFNAMLDYVGDGPKNLSILALIAGIMYLIWAEIEGINKKDYIEKMKNKLKYEFSNERNETEIKTRNDGE